MWALIISITKYKNMEDRRYGVDCFAMMRRKRNQNIERRKGRNKCYMRYTWNICFMRTCSISSFL